ncbi:MAG: site-specific integrase [Planctomycetaceae bacterium]|nr:site-specific integrase [Planctomycetaceae bacterium]
MLATFNDRHALIYKTLVLTGLRRGELASLTVGQCYLDSPVPYLDLAAADEKNREGSQIPLRSDLARDLKKWLAERTPNTSGSFGSAKLFDVPSSLRKILDRDLSAAGIPKKDDRGRSIDVHALRHTFGTMLSSAGVAPRTAQAAMRHSSIDLTMNVYTDPRQLDVAGAMERLPEFSLAPTSDRRSQDDRSKPPNGRTLAPGLAPESDVSGQHLTTGGNGQDQPKRPPSQRRAAQNAKKPIKNGPPSTNDSGPHQSGRQDTVRTFFGRGPRLGCRTAADFRWRAE